MQAEKNTQRKTMRNIFTIILLIIFTNSFCQNAQISGQITLSNSKTDYKYLTILLIQKDSIISGGVPNETGYFKLEKKVSNGNYSLKITQLGVRDFLIDSINVYNQKDINLNILYPGKCKFIKTAKPECIKKHYDNIVPIVYGLPNEKMMRKEKEGLIHLGGCVIYDCEPNYYCKLHKLEF